MAASPSTSSNYNYQVFINHRGPDVKKTLASHLYCWLSDRGFRVFLDREEMQVGDALKCQIEGAIATASVDIAIFSPRYAESEWCLNELLQMYKRKQESKATIIPVFYNVKPSDLRMRRRAGSNVDYDKALRHHVDTGRCTEETIADWKNVLFDVSHLSGLELEKYNGDEGELANSVVQLVGEKIEKPLLYVAEYPIYLDEKLQDFEKTVLQQQRHSGETKVVGIVGYGGVGKTTLATEFFNRNRSAYHQSCFLGDVRDETSLPDLQNKLYQGLTSRDLNICSVSEGKSELSHRLLGSKALVVLDDVDDEGQVKALFSPLKEALSSDSLILLTSRNIDLLLCNGVSSLSIYKLSGLDREHSQRLFCMHAFHKQQPGAGFENEVTKFLDACDGLPLSLQVLGSQLYLKESWYWEEEYLKISNLVLPAVIKRSLTISYGCLDDQEKEIFLDISCFLIDEDKDLALRIWEGSGWQGRVNLQNLERKCILEIDCKNRIRMHSHLRDLGRDFAEKELPKWHRRLWRPTDSLFHNAFIQPIVRGINMVHGISDQSFHNSRSRHPVDMTKLHLLRVEGNCLGSISQSLASSDELVWLCWKKCPYTSLPSWIPIRNLRALQVNLCADSQMLPDSVGDLRFEMPQLCLGKLPQLKHFDLQGTKVKEVSIPSDFFPNLQHLNLSFCPELVEVGELPTALTSLELQGSAALEKISGLPGLANLRLLDISGCNKIEDLPGLEKHLESKCADSQMLSDSVGDLTFEIPPLCLGNLPQLKHLDLQGTKVKKVTIPRCFCPNLQHLKLSFCPELVEVAELPTALTSLELQGSTALEKISGLPGLANLRLLDISGCNKIEELPGIEKLTLLEKLETSECKKLNESILKCPHTQMDKKRKRESCNLFQLS